MSFKPFKYALLAAGFGSAALLPFWSFAESAPAPKRERTEIHFSADQVEENSETKVITATGNVNIVREGTTLKADKITYDRKNDKITADGHVNIIQPDGTTVFADSAELETYEDRQMFLAEVGLEESGVARLIKSAYKLLNLETYFTAGVQEVRAWTYEKGWKAPQCAGVIHTDFEKGFIRAEVIKYDDYIKYGSEAAVKEAGKLGVEGKEYVVQDGDIMHFRFNV